MFDITKYFEHYRIHTYYVVLAWKDIQDLLIENNIITEEEFNKINNLIIWHDNSKIDKEEFYASAAKFCSVEKEIDKEIIDTDFKKAWEHHKSKNMHHHQTLKDYKENDWKCHLIDLICDWIAMGWEFELSAYDYYKQNKNEIDLPTEYKCLLEQILNLLEERDKSATEETLNSKLTKLWLK